MKRRQLTAILLVASALAVAVPVIGEDGAVGPYDEPQWDKPFFKKSAQSVARADLLACRNRDAAITNGRDASAKELAKALHGIWINRNGRTVHGRPVETDTAWYIDMQGTKGTAILLDRNNLGLDTLTAPFVEAGAKSSLTERTRERLAVRPGRPLSMKQVNCTYEFVDEYVKVSDEILWEALAATTPVRMTKSTSMRGAWQQLIDGGYFQYLDMPTSYQGSKALSISTALGDGKRYGFTPEGVKVTEAMVAKGLAPGAEYEMPMQVGAYFAITLTERENGPGGFRSVFLRMEAEYMGTGINLVPGEPILGVEQGEFVMEGDAFVSARSVSGSDCFTTSSCGDKNALGPEVEGKATGDLKPEFFFERMVIGMP